MRSVLIAAIAAVSLSLGVAMAQTAAPAPTAAPATTTDSPEIRELQKVEDAWSDALNKRDQYGLELVLSPLFVNVSATGDITTRNQQVVALINQEDKTATIEQRVVTVRMLGDVAVANGIYTYNHKVNGSPMQEKGVFTHVFRRQHGNWVCVNAQQTVLRQEAPGKARTTKAKSSAELPFHIPLFSKSDKSSGPTTPEAPKQ